MKRLFSIFAALALLSPLGGNAAEPVTTPVSSVIVMPWDLHNRPQLPAELKERGFNHATVYLNWVDIEPKKGQYQYQHYHPQLDALVANGLSLILVLDMGGRPYTDDKGWPLKDMSTVPPWVPAEWPDVLMKNFSGDLTWQLDFSDQRVRQHAQAFIGSTVAHFSQRYPGKVLGYAIGLQEEHEIKYGQTGYQWRDYKESTETDFQQRHGGPQPVINYNNSIAAGTPKKEPLLHTHKLYREQRLRDATCAYATTIREQGAAAMGYFAETFTSHDGIYATGMVEQLADCLDIAVIDFNFYDGYKLVPDAGVLPALANYMASVGYQKILIGAYAEVWGKKGQTAQLMPVLNQTIARSLRQPKVIGYEVGGFQHLPPGASSPTIDTASLGALAIPPTQPASPTPTTAGPGKRMAIGVLASTSNFYLWHGERSVGRNIHQDALFQAFHLLEAQPDMQVHLIGEKNLLPGNPLLATLDAIVVPHQAALPQAVKGNLEAFWQRGGVLVQDMRLGEFDENGLPTADWMHERFGIANIAWKKRGDIFMVGRDFYRLKPSRRLYTSHASIVPRKGFELLAPEVLNRHQGVMVKGERTLVLGFMPQLIEDENGEKWRQLFLSEIRKLVATTSSTAPSKATLTSN